MIFTSDRSMVHANVSMTVLSLPLKLSETVEPQSSTRSTAADARPAVVVAMEDFMFEVKKTSLGKKNVTRKNL